MYVLFVCSHWSKHASGEILVFLKNILKTTEQIRLWALLGWLLRQSDKFCNFYSTETGDLDKSPVDA